MSRFPSTSGPRRVQRFDFQSTCRRRLPLVTALSLACWVTWPGLCEAADGITVRGIARTIDNRCAELWRQHGATPAQPAGSAAFFRRLHLDLVGRIPAAADARSFVSNDRPQYRSRVIAELAESAACSNRLAGVLRDIWFPQTSVPAYRYLAEDTRRWISRQLRDRRPLNVIARELIAVRFVEVGDEGRGGSRQRGTAAAPRTLIETNEHRPERMAANATGGFLGIDLSCAQCHNHPYARWTQEQFWQTAALFQRSAARQDDGRSPPRPSIRIPDTDREVTAALFTGEPIGPWEASPDCDGRMTFAAWLSDPANPFFARHTVNEVWGALLGKRLVDSIAQEPPLADAGPRERLLGELAGALVANDFDLHLLVRGIVSSGAYQLASTGGTSGGGDAPADFTRAAVRGLSGEQLFDSLCVAAGQTVVREDLDTRARQHQRELFCQQFRIPSSQPHRSVAQALALMNGECTQAFLSSEGNRTVAALAAAPLLPEEDGIDALFWSVLSRPPRPDEVDRLRRAGLSISDRASRERRYGEIFWLLLNTVEFQTNH